MPQLNIIYDGDCPFCSRYASLLAMREQGIDVRLHNARDSSTLREFPESAGYDLNDGMLALWNGHWHHGADAMNLISRLTPTAPLARLLRVRAIAEALYPLMRFGRAVALRALGKPLLPNGTSETKKVGGAG